MKKKCTCCSQEKEIDEFYKRYYAQGGFNLICKECYRERQCKYDEKHKEKIAAYQYKYRKEHKEKQYKYQKRHKKEIAASQRKYSQPEAGKLAKRRAHHKRRARIKGAKEKLTIEQWTAILKAQENKCNICKQKFTKVKRLPTVDHIISISQRGSLSADNIQALCLSCNSKKQAKLDLHFIQTWAHEKR